MYDLAALKIKIWGSLRLGRSIEFSSYKSIDNLFNHV